MKIICMLLVAFFSFTSQFSFSQEQVCKSVSAKEFKEALTQPNTIILDIRTVEEYEAGHIERAKLFMYTDENIETRLTQLPKNYTYLIYSQDGKKSRIILQKLKEKGFPKVLELQGGYQNWE